MIGFCHMCGLLVPIQLCSFCGHWLCADCWAKPIERIVAALVTAISHGSTSCCGPFSEERNVA